MCQNHRRVRHNGLPSSATRRLRWDINMTQKRITLLKKEINDLKDELKSLSPKPTTLFKQIKQGVRVALTGSSKTVSGKSNPQKQKIIDAIKRKQEQLNKLEDQMPQPKKGDANFP